MGINKVGIAKLFSARGFMKLVYRWGVPIISESLGRLESGKMSLYKILLVGRISRSIVAVIRRVAVSCKVSSVP